jgi:hypothetical protein
MIYITGDTHSNFTRFNEDKFPIQSEMTKDDYVIICGDFGGVWTFEEEKIYNFRKRGAYFRIRDFSWWDLELPTEEEMKNGINNLKKANYEVDYIITHCCPTSIQTLLNPSYKKDILTDYLQEISEKCELKKWYFGHYHDYRQINSQFTLLYENIVSLEFNSIFE